MAHPWLDFLWEQGCVPARQEGVQRGEGEGFLPGKGDGQEDYDNTQEQPWILLAVNAVDGSVIDVTAGY